MENYLHILKRVGLALIIFGLIDIAFMAYCISQNMNYSSSFNIFAVIAGIFLFGGSLKAARTVTWFCAFMLTGFIGALFVLPFLKPIDLWALEFKLKPYLTAISFVVGPVVIAFLYWIYKMLRSRPVINAQLAAGVNTSTPRLAFVAGMALVLIVSNMMYSMVGGEDAAKAKELAKEKYGDDYKYNVESMNWFNGYVRVDLAAYDQDEIKTVQVEWQE